MLQNYEGFNTLYFNWKTRRELSPSAFGESFIEGNPINEETTRQGRVVLIHFVVTDSKGLSVVLIRRGRVEHHQVVVVSQLSRLPQPPHREQHRGPLGPLLLVLNHGEAEGLRLVLVALNVPFLGAGLLNRNDSRDHCSIPSTLDPGRTIQ